MNPAAAIAVNVFLSIALVLALAFVARSADRLPPRNRS